jgi:solute carrier family 25 carnitine/acylcarnitine transporter 20/29
MEFLKIQLQIDKGNCDSMFSIARRLIETKGILALYKGFWAQFNRDVISYGVYFWCYFRFKDYFVGEEDRFFCAGGVAGVVSWLNCYPFDPIKTLIQTTGGEKTLTQYQAYRIIVNERGFLGLFKGINPVLLRAFFVHSTIFYSNEYFRNYLTKF